jgi:Flp pilus assembly protein TadG
MLNKLFTRRRGRRGNAVLDAALVLPILLSLTFGTVEYGYYFFMKHSLEGAAREGARAAIVPSTANNTPVTTAVATALNAAGLNSSLTTLDNKYTLSISPAVTSASGTAITVSVTASWGTVGIRPLGLIGSAKVVSGTAVMRKEG